MLKGEKKKKMQQQEKKKFICPYGCGQKYATYTYPGARKHLSQCELQDDKKMIKYMKEKGLLK